MYFLFFKINKFLFITSSVSQCFKKHNLNEQVILNSEWDYFINSRFKARTKNFTFHDHSIKIERAQKSLFIDVTTIYEIQL